MRRAAAGFAPETIAVVVCTHVHFDHVGWITILVDGDVLVLGAHFAGPVGVNAERDGDGYRLSNSAARRTMRS